VCILLESWQKPAYYEPTIVVHDNNVATEDKTVVRPCKLDFMFLGPD